MIYLKKNCIFFCRKSITIYLLIFLEKKFISFYLYIYSWKSKTFYVASWHKYNGTELRFIKKIMYFSPFFLSTHSLSYFSDSLSLFVLKVLAIQGVTNVLFQMGLEVEDATRFRNHFRKAWTHSSFQTFKILHIIEIK